jgi:hypothetical protein
MHTKTRTKLRQELVARGFSEDGVAPHKTLTLTNEALEAVSVGGLLEELMSRHERIFRLMGFASGEEAKPFWDDLSAAIDALKALITRAVGENEAAIAPRGAHIMNTRIKEELQRELISRGYTADGYAPQGSMWLAEDFLRSVLLVSLIDTLFGRREKLFRMVEEEGMEHSRPSYEDVSIAVDALKAVISRLFEDD